MKPIWYKRETGLSAKVTEFTPLGHWNGQYAVIFYALGDIDYDYRGNNGTGMKVYDTLAKAQAAAKRYIKRWDNI